MAPFNLAPPLSRPQSTSFNRVLMPDTILVFELPVGTAVPASALPPGPAASAASTAGAGGGGGGGAAPAPAKGGKAKAAPAKKGRGKAAPVEEEEEDEDDDKEDEDDDDVEEEEEEEEPAAKVGSKRGRKAAAAPAPAPAAKRGRKGVCGMPRLRTIVEGTGSHTPPPSRALVCSCRTCGRAIAPRSQPCTCQRPCCAWCQGCSHPCTRPGSCASPSAGGASSCGWRRRRCIWRWPQAGAQRERRGPAGPRARPGGRL